MEAPCAPLLEKNANVGDSDDGKSVRIVAKCCGRYCSHFPLGRAQ